MIADAIAQGQRPVGMQWNDEEAVYNLLVELLNTKKSAERDVTKPSRTFRRAEVVDGLLIGVMSGIRCVDAAATDRYPLPKAPSRS